jgi:hypothetical protein
VDGELLDHEAQGVWSGLTFTSLVVGTVVIPLVFWPWSEDVFVGPKFDVLRLWVTGAALIGGTWYLTSGRRVRIMWPDVFLGAYLVLNGVAFAVSIDHRTSFFGEPLQQAGLLTVVALSATYAIARVSVNTARRLVVLSSGIALAGAIVAAYAVVQLAGADPLWSSLPRGRAFSTIGQPNWLAAYLVITIPLTLGLTIVAKSTGYRIAGLLGFLLQVTALIATRSRSGYRFGRGRSDWSGAPRAPRAERWPHPPRGRRSGRSGPCDCGRAHHRPVTLDIGDRAGESGTKGDIDLRRNKFRCTALHRALGRGSCSRR